MPNNLDELLEKAESLLNVGRLAEAESIAIENVRLFDEIQDKELPIPNVRSSVANGGKADKICSTRVGVERARLRAGPWRA
jgi:hypothetical protein